LDGEAEATRTACKTGETRVARTRTYTRLELLEDQFDHFLRFSGIADATIAIVRKGVRAKRVKPQC